MEKRLIGIEGKRRISKANLPSDDLLGIQQLNGALSSVGGAPENMPANFFDLRRATKGAA
jgi:hypothetical protein